MIDREMKREVGSSLEDAAALANNVSIQMQVAIETMERSIKSLGRGSDLEERNKIKLLKAAVDSMKALTMSAESVYRVCGATEDLL